MIHGIIDIGSNTLRMAIYDIDEEKTYGRSGRISGK